MKIRVFALLCCVIVLSSAQVLETVIRLRYAPIYRYHIPESNKLYVLTNVWPDAQAFYIYMVDCNRQSVTGMIDTRNTEGGGIAMGSSVAPISQALLGSVVWILT